MKQLRFLLRQIRRHSLRSSGRSALCIAVAALLFCAVTQFAVLRQSYGETFDGMTVEATFAGSYMVGVVRNLECKALLKDFYYESELYQTMDRDRTLPLSFCITNDIGRYTGEEPILTYAPGYDADLFQSNQNLCVVGADLMTTLGAELGDELRMISPTAQALAMATVVKSYKDAHEEARDTPLEELLVLLADDIEKAVEQETVTYTIAGVVSFETPEQGFYKKSVYWETIFCGGQYALEKAVGYMPTLRFLQGTLISNDTADEMRELGTQLAEANTSLRKSTFTMDTSRIDRVKRTMSLLDLLFPAVCGAAAAIGGAAAGMVILQSSKEVAILRVLGVEKRTVLLMLVLEQLLLFLIGLALGLAATLLLNRGTLAPVARRAAMIAAIQLAANQMGSLLFAYLASRRSPLALLQTKE